MNTPVTEADTRPAMPGVQDPGAAQPLLVTELSWREPVECFDRLVGLPGLCWLDSGGEPGPRSRFSFLCAEPFLCAVQWPHGLEIDGEPAGGDLFELLQRQLGRWRQPVANLPVPFGGGAVGLLGYGMRRWLEQLPDRHPFEAGLPDGWFGFYDVVLGFDHLSRRCWILSSGLPETGAGQPQRAFRRAKALRERLDAAAPVERDRRLPPLRWTWQPDPAGHRDAVRRTLDFIRAGDVFQANITVRAKAERPVGLEADCLYRRLRDRLREPFGAFLAGPHGAALAGASPERFLRLDPAGRVETRPIKGTRRRHPDVADDEAAAAELAASGKDKAENLMIVDLMRNDLARVCEPGSIAVPQLNAVESFAAVHHLVSTVTGRLRPGLDAVDLLRATFPGGSVTGAPKIRAMELIDELEAGTRGAYCGSVLWLGFDGAMDSNIVIRTLVLTPTAVLAQAGGGIVADSDPDAEHEEMQHKIAPLLSIFARQDEA